MLSHARGVRLAPAVIAVVAALSCGRQPLDLAGESGSDAGHPSAGDAPASDATDAARVDSPADVPIDVIAERPGDVAGDAGAALCPAEVPPLDVCNCCCGINRTACYYPSLGETREAIPNPMPSPAQCANLGCSIGVRHVCCADPAARPGADIVCANDTWDEDHPSFTVTRRDGAVCTTLELRPDGPIRTIMGTGPYVSAAGWRAPCDVPAAPRANAIGALGTVKPSQVSHLDSTAHFDIHVAVFFDSGTGVADTVRIDVDDIALARRCSELCPPCGYLCAFDGTYFYGLDGGDVLFRHTVILEPPARFTHVRSPATTMPADVWCVPPVPACDTPAIDPREVTAALRDPDVQEAFARSQLAGMTPFYGVDRRPVDGQAFMITRAGGGGFLIGEPCPPGSNTSCLEIPGGLNRMRAILMAFDRQQLADPSCEFVRP